MQVSLTDEAREQEDIAVLRESNRTLLRALDNERRRKEDVVAAVYRAVTDNITSVTFKPQAKPVLARKRGDDETAIITFSDLQLGQVTPTYSTDIAEERVERYGDKILTLTSVQRAAHPVKNTKVYLIGDLAENELIFPAQPHQVDSSLYAQVALDGPRIIGNFLRRMTGVFEHVDVVSVPGNHGDVGGGSRKSYNPETNFDRVLSTVVRLVFEASGEKRVSFRIPDGYGQASWYAVDYVGDIGFLLWHGHQARRTSGASHLPFYKLVQGWRAGALPEPFSVSICGHHHTPTFLTMGPVTHYINGTFASDAEYAIERLASNSRPAQWLLFAKPGRGVTAQYLVDLK